jgi:NADPH:quinone reductase-like Zn-dependent oxidoreductase
VGTRILTTVRALLLSKYGEAVELATVPVPEPAAGEVLVRVRAAGLNPVDVGLIPVDVGLIPEPLPFVTGFTLPGVPGWDVAGTVVALGPGTEGLPRTARACATRPGSSLPGN